jgi:hypothetical protein
MRVLAYCLLTIVLSCCTVRAQLIDQHVIVGDTGIVYSFYICDAACLTNFSFDFRDRHFFIPWPGTVGHSPENALVYFAPTVVGHVVDTATGGYGFGYDHNMLCCPGEGGYMTAVFEGYGLSDSLVRIRPREWTMDLIGDTIRQGWFGSGLPLFDNNIADTTTFSNWALESDSLHKFAMSVFDGSNEIANYRAKPFQRNLHLKYKISALHGPRLDTEYVNVQILTTVQSGSRSSVDTTHVLLRIAPEPFGWQTTVTPSQVHFLSSPHQPDSLALHLGSREQVRAFSYGKLSPPFTLIELARTDHSIDFQINNSPLGAGEYLDDLVVYADLLDLNGEVRRDSIHVPIRSTVTENVQTHYWEATSATDTGVISISSNPRKAIASFPGYARGSDDNGMTWTTLFGPKDTGLLPYQIDDADRLYTATGSRVYSLTPGEQWVAHTTRIFDSSGTLFWASMTLLPRSLFVSASGRLFGIGDYHEMSRANGDREFWQERSSTDMGQTWKAVSNHGFSADAPPECAFYILFDSLGLTQSPGCDIRVPDANVSVSTSAVDSRGNYFVGVSNELFRSTDLGFTWSRLHLFGAPISSIAASPDGSVWVGTHGTGVYFSSDRGISFSGVNGGLGSLDVSCLNVQRGGRLYAGTRDKGVFRSLATMPISQLGVQPSKKSPMAFAISPNPSKGLVTVTIDMPRSSSGLLQVYDLLGRQVMNKATEFRSGSNTLNLDLSTLVAGSYFIRLESGRSVLTQKLLISK